MSRLHSFITLVCVAHSFAIPVTDDEDDEDGCWSQQLHTTPPPNPTAALLAPHTASPATLSAHRSTPVLSTVLGILIALVACSLAACYVIHRRRKGDPKSGFPGFRFRHESKKRLSDESWVSPALPSLGSPGSPLSQDVELRQYAYPQRRLVLVSTPVTTPTDTEFEIPPVRVPSPVYLPSPSSSTLSPAPSNPRLSCLLSSTFRDTVVDTPARPTTACLIQTARSYAHAYRPSSMASTSLYTPPTSSVRLAGTRSRASFYDPSWDRARDTLSTVTTSDTVCTVPHLLRTANDDQPSSSPFADPQGTPLGLKVRLSDASEHARYRLREREREHRRQLQRDLADSGRGEFRWRDSESVLRDIGW